MYLGPPGGYGLPPYIGWQNDVHAPVPGVEVADLAIARERLAELGSVMLSSSCVFRSIFHLLHSLHLHAFLQTPCMESYASYRPCAGDVVYLF
jgi:hypothetical protein